MIFKRKTLKGLWRLKNAVFGILANKLYFDFITLDCTNVTLEFSDEDGHMGFCQIEKLVKRLKEINAIDDKTIKYVNHFSHNGNALHDYI